MNDLGSNRGDPRLPGRDLSWLWSWIPAKEGRGAGPLTLAFPLVAFAVGITLFRFPFVYPWLLFAFFLAPFPILVGRHCLGRRGWWSVAALVASVLPYLIVVAGIVWTRAGSHVRP
jgi:hypothetical protein